MTENAPGADGTATTPGVPAVDEGTMERLHERLVAAAEQQTLLDVAYRTVASPVGELLLAATEVGLVRVAFTEQDPETVLTELARRVSPRVLRAPARLDPAVRELDEYFAGRRHVFELPLDLRLAAGFRRTVLSRLQGIGYGTTATYTAVARTTGSPGAVRAVGTACARNPLPVVVPCHRVVRSDGTMGGYVGGLAAKSALLALESGTDGNRARVDR